MGDSSVEGPMSHQHRLRQFFRRIAPALGLALFAPLVGEYLLGNIVFTLGAILLLIVAARTVRRPQSTSTVTND